MAGTDTIKPVRTYQLGRTERETKLWADLGLNVPASAYALTVYGDRTMTAWTPSGTVKVTRAQ